MNSILFAGNPYAYLDGLCFALSVFCGYMITRHFTKEHNDQSGFFTSIVVGMGIGLLLILDDFYKQFSPHFARILVGLIGGVLGYLLSKVSTKK
ncbi:MAG: hypothetical protein LBJ67_10545 [Planctomycetaceae bacterium]|jgi:uncharacterized membrane protein YeaQ/YmgE (transglycosylase-associated protein family)|nr:hypothetical protein [Planctomycetaceae bacterium]